MNILKYIMVLNIQNNFYRGLKKLSVFETADVVAREQSVMLLCHSLRMAHCVVVRARTIEHRAAPSRLSQGIKRLRVFSDTYLGLVRES